MECILLSFKGDSCKFSIRHFSLELDRAYRNYYENVSYTHPKKKTKLIYIDNSYSKTTMYAFVCRCITSKTVQ